jgi:uncharacterized cupredoxin-like copper-binding protein
MHSRPLIATAVLAAGSLLGIGCGGSSKHDSTQAAAQPGAQAATSAQQGAAGAARHVTIDMGEFFFKPSNLTVPAGKVVISAPNTGRVVHELVLLKTALDPGKLQTEKNGNANEDAYSGPGEIADVAAGATKQATFDLKPGTYVMICNVPGHYAAGMYGRLIVK